MSYKLVGVRYPNSIDVTNKRDIPPVVKETSESSQLSVMISDMLFADYKADRCNYVLTRWGGKMYICEPVDIAKKQYTKTMITYHPYQSLT